MTNEQKLAICENIEMALEALREKVLDEHDLYYLKGMLCVLELSGIAATVDLKSRPIVRLNERD